MPVPFVIYADFEAITKKVQGWEQSEEMKKRSYTEAYQTHEDCGCGYKVICCYDDKYSKPIQSYRGENAVYKFMDKMLEEVEYCKAVIKKRFNKPLVLTDNDEMCFKLMDKCHIWNKEYTDKDVRVRDHCHITGKFRGSAHQECNLELRIKPDDIKIPIIFHNLRGCDSHFIMQQIGKIAKNYAYKDMEGKDQPLTINAIPNNMEKYMAFMLGNHLTFIDSFQFMSSSLDKLVENVTKCGKCETCKPDSCIRRSVSDSGRIIQHQTSYPCLECKNCKKVGKSCVNPVYNNLRCTSEEFKGDKLHLMSKKGVYPYDYMDSFEKFNQTELPTKEHFYSILNDQDITNDEYDHAKKVWKTFKLKNMGDYHDLYLGSDVLLLTDVLRTSERPACNITN